MAACKRKPGNMMSWTDVLAVGGCEHAYVTVPAQRGPGVAQLVVTATAA